MQLNRTDQCSPGLLLSGIKAVLVRNWFTNQRQFEVLYLPPYSPFLNPIECIFSACPALSLSLSLRTLGIFTGNMLIVGVITVLGLIDSPL